MLSLSRVSKQFTKRGSNTSKYYSTAEVEQILGSKDCSLFLSTYLHVAFLTGARTGEILGLKWENLNFKNDEIFIEKSNSKGVLKETKTGTVRTIPLVDKLKLKLFEWKTVNTNSEFVFPNMKTNELIVNVYHHITKNEFKPFLSRLGIEYKTLYATRSSAASRAMELNVPMNVVQNMLGHAELNTTQRYYIKSGLQDKNVAKEYMNNLF